MNQVTMYCTETCRYCTLAELLLKKKGVTAINKIYVSTQHSERSEMVEKTGRQTVPQVFIGDIHVGGYDDLADLERKGELDKLLAG
ncbi:MAG: glutaredoxin 3 [Thermoleophilia bacterium]